MYKGQCQRRYRKKSTGDRFQLSCLQHRQHCTRNTKNHKRFNYFTRSEPLTNVVYSISGFADSFVVNYCLLRIIAVTRVSSRLVRKAEYISTSFIHYIAKYALKHSNSNRFCISKIHQININKTHSHSKLSHLFILFFKWHIWCKL